MLVEMAIGDAYGAAFEFVGDDVIARDNDLSRYRAHPDLPLGGGRYTDDTQMSVAIAEHLLSGEATTAANLAGRFVAAFRRDPRPGYSKRLYAVLLDAADGHDLLAGITPNSNRSGAAMRVSPIGLLADLERVVELAQIQAAVTHDTPEGRMSAAAVAVMAHYLAHGLGPRRDLGGFIERHVPGHDWARPWQGRTDITGMACAHAAISLVQRGTGRRQVLRDAVALGGDVDTVAAIAMFSASLCEDIVSDLPQPLYDGLEKGSYGLPYLRDLDVALTNLVRREG